MFECLFIYDPCVIVFPVQHAGVQVQDICGKFEFEKDVRVHSHSAIEGGSWYERICFTFMLNDQQLDILYHNLPVACIYEEAAGYHVAKHTKP